jgi:hypothetical protein
MGADGHAQAEKQRRRIEPLGSEPNSPTAYFCGTPYMIFEVIAALKVSNSLSVQQ